MRTAVELGRAALLAVCLIAGPAGAVTGGGGGGGYESEQGPEVFGTKDAGLEGAKIPTVPANGATYQRLTLTDGQLHAQKAGGDVAGAGVVGLDLVATRTAGADLGKPVTLHIAAARLHKNVYTHVLSDVWEYEIRVVDGGTSSPLCDDARNAALAVPGLWKAGAASAFDQWIAFACVPVEPAKGSAAVAGHFVLQKPASYTRAQRQRLGLPIDEVEGPRWAGGAAAKCIDYGYAPWPSGSAALGKTTRTQHKVAASVDAARQFHNLCTRAMTADYAADGRSHTIRGTQIRIFDLTNLPIDDCTGVGLPTSCTLVPPNQPTVPPPAIQQVADVKLSLGQFHRAELVAPSYSQLSYESVWHVDDGVARAACLAKVRWQTIDATELGKLHWSPEKDRSGGKNWQYCDARTIGSFRAHDTDPVLFVYSAINEKGLYRFKISSNPARYLTTTRIDALDDGRIALAPGLPCEASPCIAEKFEGDVLSPDVPEDLFRAWTIAPLFLMRNAAGEFATVAGDAAHQAPKLPAGYHFAEIAPAAPPTGSGDGGARAGSAVARPSVATAPSATAGNPVRWTTAPEGFVFGARVELPAADRFGATDAQVSLLHWFEHGERFCTALDACEGFTGEAHGMGYVLLPSAMSRAHAPVGTARPTATAPR